MNSDYDHLRIARVLHEDADYLTISLAKDLQTKLDLEPGDTFFTITFVHKVGDRMVPWLPWAAS